MTGLLVAAVLVAQGLPRAAIPPRSCAAKSAPPVPVRVSARPVAPTGDPYGFHAYLATMFGRSDMVYDPSLDRWCHANNTACAAKYGAGPPAWKGKFPDLHHVFANGWSCAGWGYRSTEEVARGWLGSPEHRAAILRRDQKRYGIVYGPGPYWTLQMTR